jgi:hypothetical protein
MVLDPPSAAPAVTIVCQMPHAPWWHLPAEIFAALSGLAGVILALRGEMKPREKVIWIAGISLLTVLELGMIMSSDRDAEKNREYAMCLELQQFQGVLTAENTDFAATVGALDLSNMQSRQQYQEEVLEIGATGVESVFKKHLKLREDLGQLSWKIDRNRNEHQQGLVGLESIFRNSLARSRDKVGEQRRHDQEVQTRKDQYDKQFADDFGPKMVDLLKRLDTALGRGNETDPVAQFCATARPDQADICINDLKSLANKLSP